MHLNTTNSPLPSRVPTLVFLNRARLAEENVISVEFSKGNKKYIYFLHLHPTLHTMPHQPTCICLQGGSDPVLSLQLRR